MVITVALPDTPAARRAPAPRFTRGPWCPADRFAEGVVEGAARGSQEFGIGGFLSADSDTFMRGQKQPSGE